MYEEVDSMTPDELRALADKLMGVLQGTNKAETSVLDIWTSNYINAVLTTMRTVDRWTMPIRN